MTVMTLSSSIHVAIASSRCPTTVPATAGRPSTSNDVLWSRRKRSAISRSAAAPPSKIWSRLPTVITTRVLGSLGRRVPDLFGRDALYRQPWLNGGQHLVIGGEPGVVEANASSVGHH